MSDVAARLADFLDILRWRDSDARADAPELLALADRYWQRYEALKGGSGFERAARTALVEAFDSILACARGGVTGGGDAPAAPGACAAGE